MIDFLILNQRTTDYDDFCRLVGETPSADLLDLGVLFYGANRTLSKLTSRLHQLP
jgi:hypothetical protein